MVQVLASTLSGYPVMTTDGVEIGTLENVTVDVESGALERLVVDPDDRHVDGFERDDDGRLLIPADRYRARDDYVLVERG